MMNIKRFIESCFENEHRTPTVREIAKEMNISTSCSHRYLVEMAEKNMISYVNGKMSTDKIDMVINHRIFYICSHFLSVCERKSRINSFSISSCFIFASLRARIYFNCATLSVSDIEQFFGGLPLFFNAIPAAIFLCFMLYLSTNFLTCVFVNPSVCPISL